MSFSLGRGALAALALASVAFPAGAEPGAEPGADLPGWRLVWADEFQGPGLDPGRWTFDLGAGGWGNGEAQRYTSRPENLRLEDGRLVIEARAEKLEGSYYTSARIKTQGRFAFTYGRAEARMRVPPGKGLWPAFWLLGEDLASRGWPACGEIDIMEFVGRDPDHIYGTIHGPGYSGDQGPSTRWGLGRAVDGDYHTYAVEWDPDRITWFCDGVAYATRGPADAGGQPWVFDHPFFLILNLAVGGRFPGPVGPETAFPARLLVDYVRVYARE